MAERNPNRKSNRNFNLDKAGQHSFDLGKATTRKFELGKDDEPTIPPISEPSGVDSDNDGNNPVKGKKSIVWIVVAIIVAAIILFFCFRGCNSEKDEQLQSTGAEQEMTTTSDESNINSDDEEVSPVNDDVEDSQAEQEVETTQPVDTPVEQPQPGETTSAPAQPVVEQAPQQTASSDIETEALNVIRGDYGVGQERKDRLGSQYSAIQARVNEMKRQGLF